MNQGVQTITLVAFGTQKGAVDGFFQVCICIGLVLLRMVVINGSKINLNYV